MSFSVTILGSGAAVPLSYRNPSAQLVNVNEHIFLFDCSEGTQVQLRRNHVSLQKIRHIFITHLHGDHYFGVMGLITTMHLLGRENELHIHAYHQLEDLIERHLHASQTRLRYPLIFHSIEPDKHKMVLDHKAAEVYTIPMKHDFPTCGFLIREKEKQRNIRKDFLEGKELEHEDYRRIKKGEDYVDKNGKVYENIDITHAPHPPRSYAYCTDTAYDERIIPMVRDVDLLYHEATFMEDRKADAEAKFHSTAAEAATIAKKANAGQLVIGHFSARYKELDDLLAEARAVFPNTVLADDGLTLSL